MERNIGVANSYLRDLAYGGIDPYAEYRALLDQIPEGASEQVRIPRRKYRAFVHALREAGLQTERQVMIVYDKKNAQVSWSRLEGEELRRKRLGNQLITRHPGGMVSWFDPNKSPEENEQIGIRNMQGLIIEKIPEFIRFIPQGAENPDITEEFREEARSLILEKVGKYNDFMSIFGASPITRIAPYFQGSHSIALKKALEPLGVKFKFRDFTQPADFWKRSKEEVINNVKLIFLEEYPEFAIIFLNEEHRINPERQESAKQYILDKLKEETNFYNLFTVSITNKQSCPHFNGSKEEVVRSLLESWGIKTNRRDFLIHWNGKSEDECISLLHSVWLEKFPDFDQLFPRSNSGQINRTQIEEAKAYILERVNNRKKFCDVFPESVVIKNGVPYFEGSYIVAAIKVFSKWGIELDSLDFPEIRRWKGKSEKEVVFMAQSIIRKTFPEIDQLIKGNLAPEDTERLKHIIVRHLGTQQKFLSVFPRTALRVDYVPYFNNSFRLALKKVCQVWGVTIEDKDFAVKEFEFIENTTDTSEADKYLRDLAFGEDEEI